MRKMKKVQAFLATVLLLTASLSSIPASAEDTVIYDNLEYRIILGSAELVGSVDKTVTSITIPAEVNGYPVSSWADGNCFSDCKNLMEILVDEENTYFESIDGVLFDQSNALLCYPCAYETQTYIVPEKTSKISREAFKNCNTLTEITIPETTAIEDNAFYNCKSLEKFTNPVRLSRANAIIGCVSLKELTLDETQESYPFGSLRMDAFSELEKLTVPENCYLSGWINVGNCPNLKSVELQSKVAEELSLAISDCENLESISVPIIRASENAVGRNPVKNIQIQNCNKLVSLNLSGILADYEYSPGYQCMVTGCARLEELDLPNASSYVIENCPGLSNMTFTQGENFKIAGCPSITKISFDLNYGLPYESETDKAVTLESCTNLQDLYFYNSMDDLSAVCIPDSEYAQSYRSLADMGVTVHCRRANQDMQEMCKEYNIPYVIIEDEVIPGDVHNDGELDITDAVMLNRIAVGVEKSTPSRQMAGDLNGNGKLELTDSMAILRKLVGLDA